MNKRIVIALLFCVCTSASWAQSPLTPREVHGAWKMVIDLDAETADSAPGRIALNALQGVFDEVDVWFEFLDDHQMRVTVDAFGDKEMDEGTWRLTDQGELILSDTDSFEFDVDDTVWLREGDRLVPYAQDDDGGLERESNLSLKRIR